MLNESSKNNNENLTTGGFLIKAPKFGQILEIDIPAIGPNTINLIKKAKLDGVVLQSSHVLIAEKQRVISLVRDYEMFLVVKNFLGN